jgi:hypothetical protein
VQQVVEQAEAGVGQALGVVEHEHGLDAELGDLGQQRRHRFQFPLRLLAETQRKGLECRARGGGAQRTQQSERKTRRLVLAVHGKPGHRGTGLQPLAAPLQQQRGLAEAGGRDHADGRALSNLAPQFRQARALDCPSGQARRRGFEDEFGFEHGFSRRKNGSPASFRQRNACARGTPVRSIAAVTRLATPHPWRGGASGAEFVT